MRYLLDTNVITAIIRRHHGVGEKMRQLQKSDIVLSSIVLFEIHFGAAKATRGDFYRDMVARLEFTILAFEPKDAAESGRLRAELQRLGTPIGPYDTMIAGHALARNLTLVTHNTREFERVPGLRLEDWQA